MIKCSVRPGQEISDQKTFGKMWAVLNPVGCLAQDLFIGRISQIQSEKVQNWIE